MNKKIIKIENVKNNNEQKCYICDAELKKKWHIMLRFDRNFIHLCNKCASDYCNLLEVKINQAKITQEIERW